MLFLSPAYCEMIHSYLQIDHLHLAYLILNEAESCELARWICGLPRLSTLEVRECSFHDGFHSRVKVGAPSVLVSFDVMPKEDHYNIYIIISPSLSM